MGASAPADLECGNCHEIQTQVIDTRAAGGPLGKCIRRRRRCLKCQHRFTTWESKEHPKELFARAEKTRRAFAALRQVLQDEELS
jgi:transcriptional repressor NrdR